MNDWNELEAPAHAEIKVRINNRTTTYKTASSKTQEILRTSENETWIQVQNIGESPVTLSYESETRIGEDNDWEIDQWGTLGTLLNGQQDSWPVMANASIKMIPKPEIVEVPIDEYYELSTRRGNEDEGNPGERLFEYYLKARGLLCQKIDTKKKKKTADMSVNIGTPTAWEIKSLCGSQTIRDALEQSQLHSWTVPNSRWTSKDRNEDRIDKASKQLASASADKKPTVIGLINRQDDYDPAALSREQIAGMLYGDEVVHVTKDYSHVARRQHDDNTALQGVSAIAVLRILTPTVPFHGKNITDMCRDTVRLCELQIYHNKNAKVSLDKKAVRKAGIVQYEWTSAEPQEAFVRRGPIDTSAWDVIPFTEDTVEVAQRRKRDEAIQRFVCSINDSIAETIADTQRHTAQQSRTEVPISRHTAVVWPEEDQVNSPINRLELRNIVITPDERARIRRTNRPVTEVLNEILRAPDRAPTKEQKTAASYAAVRVEELRWSTTTDPTKSKHTAVRERIEKVPERCSGKPTVHNTRVAVSTMLGRIGSGESPGQTMEDLSIEPEDVVTTLAYVLEVLVRDEAIKQRAKE